MFIGAVPGCGRSRLFFIYSNILNLFSMASSPSLW
ncbi:hypothetical protein BACCAP_01644 [Pseudoflavonifractor capillosus ATCC 29799]|uniref:Uncharacterized protein n=1 Tax=Pseudoflavonifractor capillosus ATCC 29799 TaxID=411467 RepID=A6NTW4_9FIRM|nr:hypothetical protein BACCAP_01644 [Pseudoflavonifractor capillosus ATCC 29799]